MSLRGFLFSLIVVLATAGGAAGGAQEELAQNRVELLQALQAGDVERLGALYAEDAHYTPATSPFRRDGREEVKALWVAVFHRYPTRRFVIRQISVRIYDTTAVETGYFDFGASDRVGTVVNLSGRYSATWVKLGGKWLIVDHHVSQLPRPLPEPISPPYPFPSPSPLP